MVAKLKRTASKRAEILRKAALDYHAGRITRAEYLRTVVTFRQG